MEPVYLDYAATSPLLPEVKARMIEVMNLELGNASALHTPGNYARRIIDEAREQVAKLINADPEEIIFTSGGSESNNTVMNIFQDSKIVVSSIEHPSVLEAARAHAEELVLLNVDKYGFVEFESIPRTADLVSVMLANNELGSIEPIHELVERTHGSIPDSIAKKELVDLGNATGDIPGWVARRQKLRQASVDARHRTYVHTDATQALGKIKIDVKALGVDYLTMSAHKIGGPVGIGALYVRKDAKFKPFILGGHQESRRRAGTMNTVAIAGFGAAAKWCWDNWSCKKWQKVAELRDELRRRIITEIPYSSCNSPEENVLPNILNVSFQAAEGESIQLYLDTDGIAISTGSACASGDLQPSHVLMATRHDAEVAHNSIRFSLGLNTTSKDIDRVMGRLPQVIERLQGMSTIKLKEQYE